MARAWNRAPRERASSDESRGRARRPRARRRGPAPRVRARTARYENGSDWAAVAGSGRERCEPAAAPDANAHATASVGSLRLFFLVRTIATERLWAREWEK